MAIRFQCVSCNQPIEVDESWGGRTVACPYCRSTVIAPTASTLGDIGDIPTASPAAGGGIDTRGPASALASERSNVVALVALILAMIVIALFGLSAMIAAPHELEMKQIMEQVEQSPGSPTQAIMEYAQSHGGNLPTWLFMLGMIQMVTLVTSVVAIVCGIVGLRHVRRRGMAVAALAICGAVTIYFCAAMFFSFGFAGVSGS